LNIEEKQLKYQESEQDQRIQVTHPQDEPSTPPTIKSEEVVQPLRVIQKEWYNHLSIVKTCSSLGKSKVAVMNIRNVESPSVASAKSEARKEV